MLRLFASAFLIVATLMPAPLRAAEAPAPDLATGIRQVREGDFEGAVVTLQAVTRKLQGQTTRRQELAQAHLYLGIAHVALDQPEQAKTAFKAALVQNKELRLTPDRFSPKVIAAFEDARRESAAASAGASKGGGKPLLWVGVGVAAAGAVALAATRDGDSTVRLFNARFVTPVIVCENGSEGVELRFGILVDADNPSPETLTVQMVEARAVIEASPQFPGEVGFSSVRPTTTVPSSVAPRTPTTLLVSSTLVCGNSGGDPARSNTWLARLTFTTSAGVFHLETTDRMRVDLP
jgi:hypothetical protein